ncbi:MAG: hypothetical protein HQL14_08480 [Candidatus Omnitrophica bacterium]|nr:hypothetical protein [Candidatus Omnitrophota bacterium]
MGIFQRIGRGWQLAMASWGIIDRNKSLLIFPLLSGLSLLFMMGSFFIGTSVLGGGLEGADQSGHGMGYLFLFILYFINSTVIIFFNMALIHSTFKILKGETATVSDGIDFSLSKLNLVLSWALVSATIGLILKIMEDKHAVLTNIIIGIFGMLWSLATFLVVPVMVYENLGVSEAIKRSTSLFKSTWGERVGAGFSFGAIGFILFCVIGIWLGYLIIPLNFFAFIIALVFTGSMIGCLISTVQTVFLAAVYQYAAGIPVEGINKIELGGIFTAKP